MEQAYVPIWLDCSGRTVIVIGGGPVAERKVSGLLNSGANITIISPTMTERLLQLAQHSEVSWIQRPYRQGDLRGAFLVYTATNHADINQQVVKEAKETGALVNSADEPRSGDFITPSVVRRGRMSIAVSASGSSPGAVARIAKQLDQQYGDEYRVYFDFLHQIRQTILSRIEDPSKRRHLLKKVLELDILDEIREGRFELWSDEQRNEWIADNQEG
ncbi:precorrin-2 dehydrogenase/sirohydrochlorin ferrochelatase family protein [Paenibacillus urinalis]|uniref:precorrin-2 dehydrogenase n=1 Tax=Paenibacillus urinalis TaxID=521520 RepID=A0AAX3MZM8_9BACL|nr:bifunctional precorrin-2 dehydrogenase/sirohydrochlorin ferrochelatase [Paenibacillus urinalis]WDH81824.1 bifunctional precorrin-2 dehydrogenase/sirohydrochlorin ferrochelatase [Paenibacillus urinalis]